MKQFISTLILIGSQSALACGAMSGIADYDFLNSPIGFLSMVLESKALEEAVVKHDSENINRQVGNQTMQTEMTMVPRENSSPTYKIDIRWHNACSISYNVEIVDVTGEEGGLCGTPPVGVMVVDEGNLPTVACLEGKWKSLIK